MPLFALRFELLGQYMKLNVLPDYLQSPYDNLGQAWNDETWMGLYVELLSYSVTFRRPVGAVVHQNTNVNQSMWPSAQPRQQRFLDIQLGYRDGWRAFRLLLYLFIVFLLTLLVPILGRLLLWRGLLA